jgi:hypothetical protein
MAKKQTNTMTSNDTPFRRFEVMAKKVVTTPKADIKTNKKAS